MCEYLCDDNDLIRGYETMKITKMHGIGNDYVYTDERLTSLPSLHHFNALLKQCRNIKTNINL